MKSLMLMMALVSFSSQVANADCLSRMVEDGKIVAKRDRAFDRVGSVSHKVGIGGAVVALFVPPLGFTIFFTAVAGTFTSLIYEWVDHRGEKDFALTNIIAYTQGLSQGSKEYYEALRTRVQATHPEITDEQIHGAVTIGNRDESLCPKGKGMTMKRTAKAVVSIVAELNGTGASE